MEGPLHIIAAADDPVVALFYRDALSGLGHRVTLTGTGPGLIELCRAARDAAPAGLTSPLGCLTIHHGQAEPAPPPCYPPAGTDDPARRSPPCCPPSTS